MSGDEVPTIATLRLSNPMGAIAWLALFLPGLPHDPRVELPLAGAVFLLGCFALIAKPSPWEARGPSREAAVIFLLIQASYLASYLYSAAFNGAQIASRDCAELARYLVLGVFSAYLIRHHDADARRSVEAAVTAMPYVFLSTRAMPAWMGPATWGLSWPFDAPEFSGYVSALALCHLLFFSRARLRWTHAAVAAAAVVFADARAAWGAGLLIVAVALSARLHQGMSRRGIPRAAPAAWAVFALLAGCLAYHFHVAKGGGTHAQAFRYVQRSPVLGWGPALCEGLPDPGSQYLSWLLKNGALGMGLILSGLSLVGWRLLSAVKADPERRAGAAAFLGALAWMLTAGQFLDSYRLVFLSGLLAAGMREEGG